MAKKEIDLTLEIYEALASNLLERWDGLIRPDAKVSSQPDRTLLLYLPACSPDFNPIEWPFQNLKRFCGPKPNAPLAPYGTPSANRYDLQTAGMCKLIRNSRIRPLLKWTRSK
jgi:transposase